MLSSDPVLIMLLPVLIPIFIFRLKEIKEGMILQKYCAN